LDSLSGQDISTADPDYLRRYRATCDNIRISAGIYPSFDEASSGAGACWQDDPGAAYWWVDEKDYYLPAFTDRAYISAIRTADGIASTQEFGFGLAVACSGSLIEGDEIVITVRGSSTDGYTTGDAFRLHVITVGAGADDISTLTAGDGDVTFVGNVTVGPDAAGTCGYGTWIFRMTGATTFVGYRVG
jgi:hypothetical protein